MKKRIKKFLCKFNIFSSCFTVNGDIDNSHSTYNIRCQADDKNNFLSYNNVLGRSWSTRCKEISRRTGSQDTSRSI